MKPSGVEWIGDVPEHWEVKRLKYIAAINKEALPETTDGDFEIQYIDIGNVTLGRLLEPPRPMLFKDAPSRARRIVKQNETLVSTVRTYLKAIALIEDQSENLIASTGFAVVSPHSFFDHKYLFHLISSPRIIDRICALSVGVSYPSINSSDLANIEVWLPKDKSEQTTIAHYLDGKTAQIDQAIAEKESLIELFREERQAIINHAVTKGIRAGVKMKASGVEWIGDVPEGWAVKRLAFVGKFSKGGGISRSELADEGLPAILYGDIYTKYDIRVSTVVHKIAEETARKAVAIAKGALLLTGSGETKEDIGRCIVYLGEATAYAGGDVIIFQQTGCDSLFLSYFLNTPGANSEKARFSKGEIVVHTYASTLRNLFVSLPPLPEQTAIAHYLTQKTAQIDTAISGIQHEITLLQEYRKALIFEAVTGKVDVRG